MALALSTIKTLASAAEPGLWAHGNGLCLVVARGRASWSFRYSIKGKRRLMTIEPYEPITAPKLKALELVASGLKQQVKAGRDPLAEREALEAVPAADTFEEFARAYIEEQKPGWRSADHATEWRRSLERSTFPIIGAKRPHEITTDDVLLVLRQPYNGSTFWDARKETASRVRGRIETVIGAAKAKGLSNPDTRYLWEGHHNPAAWSDNIEYWLKGRRQRGHYEAMDWPKVPALAKILAAKTDYGSLALLLNILCATRASGARKALWSEIDLEAAVWTIPGDRMKSGAQHAIPLSTQAVELLRRLPKFADNPLVFPGEKHLRPMTPGTLTSRLREISGDSSTVHAFRSSFRDWAAETTNHPDHVVKAALAHTNKDRVDAAYRRKTAFDRRKQLMQQWSDFLLTNEKDYQAEWKRFLAMT